MAGAKQQVEVEGRRITLSNLDKVLYPATGTTKGDVIAYYAAIAPHMLPHLRDRPVTRKRWVDGVGTDEHPGKMFFQKDLDAHTPEWVLRRAIQHRDHANDYPLANDVATLTWLGQVAALELHVPQWRFGRTGDERRPDRLVLDLDPGPGAGLPECVEVATAARAILRDMGLEPYPVTSGSKGIHLYAALDGSHDADAISQVAHELARALEADHPDLVVSDMRKALRQGKVLVDWSQNNPNKTTVAPYSLRGRSRPTVAVPRTWRELASPTLRHLEMDEVVARMRRRADPLAPVEEGHRESLEPTPERLASFARKEPDAADDRLATYRSKRDAAKTSEPVPADAPAPSEGRSFVIQEHHARALHWDFRLEHDGVLVSWALPKGVPTEHGTNHLAVQTEDHPVEYGSFEGTIPAGEYGGGEVTIWDAGTYELEKWRDGKEVIATLHGRGAGTGIDGPRRYALIHTGGHGKADANWLIHLMEPADAPAKAHARPARAAGLAKAGGRTRVGARRKGGAASAPAPMLATAATGAGLDPDGEWAVEMKWDGYRAIAVVADGRATITSRNGVDLTAAFPELAELPDALDVDDAVLDGEIVVLGDGGRPDFGLLQTRLGLTGEKDVARARRSAPVHLMLFDALAIGDRVLVEEPYRERRAALLDAVRSPGRGRIQVPPAFDGDLDGALATSRELGLEGVVAKRVDAPYESGRRSSAWIKVKHHRAQEVVVGGWRPGSGSRASGVGSLLVGVPGPDGLEYAGRVGTGFSERDLADALRRFRPLARKTSPFADVPAADARDARWITPRLVGEVEFAEWTSTGRLRQASWRGWRHDKSPDEVVRED
ncbi:ATP-dependent DNA ligase [Clavibacter tessellarius]|uniref:DNA ligase (ATP) n=1 Tax=Clavibacter tessellarius TaxID=31965 RepID=A0A225C9X9_9MICO|nr:ATP-dependent DNA ligase [Clavibacter michiganensis]OQJ63329.1 ATP-dependent DNA ligase [Clavibacter michiganensis subsp. tessellarius]UKF33691.1 ATP-dependent DNA ligase [Clavibacter michiganensis subsp. tessellarius]